MLKVALIGTGNLAFHLQKAFTLSPDLELIQVVGRDTQRLEQFSSRATVASFDQLDQSADLYFLAISDDALEEVSRKIKVGGALIHCSGAKPLSILPKNSPAGVFYPLQSFSREASLNLKEIPVFIESTDSEVLEQLRYIGMDCFGSVTQLDSPSRLKIHLAAVIANNFSNHLWLLTQEMSEGAGVAFDQFHPLIKETLQKMIALGPFEAQTGPARRGDLKSLQSHLSLLKDKSSKEIYKSISDSIINTYGK